jgi:hypothetical protein
MSGKPKIYRVSRRSLRQADPPHHLREAIETLVPVAGLRAWQVADLVLPFDDRLWILLFASDLPGRLCRTFARICALRCLAFWLHPHPECVVGYLRTGKKALAREARAASLPLPGDAEKSAAWAATAPLFEADRIDLALRRWTMVSDQYRAWAAAASARKAGIVGESQIADLLDAMGTHPTVLSLRMASGAFESADSDPGWVDE